MPGLPEGVPVAVPRRMAGALERAARGGYLARPLLSWAGLGQAPVLVMTGNNQRKEGTWRACTNCGRKQDLGMPVTPSCSQVQR